MLASSNEAWKQKSMETGKGKHPAKGRALIRNKDSIELLKNPKYTL